MLTKSTDLVGTEKICQIFAHDIKKNMIKRTTQKWIPIILDTTVESEKTPGRSSVLRMSPVLKV